MFVFVSKPKLLAEAKEAFKAGAPGSMKDYKRALNKHWVSFSEYAYQYEFPNKTEVHREEFVSRLRMKYFYLRYSPIAERPLFGDKDLFLKRFAKYIRRDWLYAPDASFEDFERLVTNSDCIVKPSVGSLG